jgi:transaldolase
MFSSNEVCCAVLLTERAQQLGLTSNPMIFDHAIKNSHDYDEAIHQGLQKDKPVEDPFFELAIEDPRRAADLFLPTHKLTNGVDGWVSLEVSPLPANDTANAFTSIIRIPLEYLRLRTRFLAQSSCGS